MLAPFNLQEWIDENREMLKPPVKNRRIYRDNTDFVVMICGGPNIRKDYHYNESEELFYQIEGDIELKLVDDGQFTTVPIRQGEMFLLPPKILHSPQRPAGTIGLVIEKIREEGDEDGLVYFCDSCRETLFDERFFLDDIERRLPEVIKKFYGSEEHRTCKSCGDVMPMPAG